ncbi:MAG: OmcA/MtrC family decaheme c-type cytochrome [Bryobacterales bacterium]|nr:OmcA/MtrC family decaheme c-type cytochrome [Bryobacterales bacterium]
MGTFRNRRVILRISLTLMVLTGAAVLVSAPKSPFTQNDRAYYLDEKTVNYVRPGLKVTVTAASIATDGVITARVKFTDPAGVPLDKDGIQTPGVIAASAIAAYIPNGQSQYTAYTTRRQTSAITGESAIQANADSGGTWTKVADGEYAYKFGFKAPANYEKSSTHAIGVYASRNLTEFELGTALSDSVFPFVPDGSAKPETRDAVRTESCQRCHVDDFAFHGTTGRTSVQMCVLCHTPQSTDPDTGNTLDFPVMVHKIHMGKDLPGVKAGGKYQIIGFGNAVHDYSHIGFPTDQRNCTVCHEQTTGAAQARNYLTKPNRAACGSCHDDVNFETGENHVNLPQVSDNQCSGCHIPQGELEFDASILGAHTIPYNSRELTGFQFAITKVDNGSAGKKPSVTFTLADKNGNPLAPSNFSSLNAVLGGPTTDYITKFPGAATSGYVSESVLKATGGDGVYTYTLSNAIPENARGTFSIGLEGRRIEVIYKGTRQEQSVQYGPKKNAVAYFTVDGTPVFPRRQVVAIEKCQRCHVSLRLHGENRIDTIEQCVTCHNPVETDVARRPASAGAPQSIDFRQMIHNIHGGERTKNAYKIEDYIIYGFGGAVHNFSEVTFPGRLASCDMCHVNGSQQLPLPETNAEVSNPRGYLNPGGPVAAACLSCHRGKDAASHALANTTTLGESCAACHGSKSEFGVVKVHAAPSTPQANE